MKRVILFALALILIVVLCACGGEGASSTQSVTPSSQNPANTVAQESSNEEDEGRGDIIDETIPDGADVISQGVYYYELAELSGDFGDGLSPREGAELVDGLLADMGFYSDNGGIPAENCVYLSLDELTALDSAMGRECYIYTVGIGTPDGGLMGDDYEVIYRVSVDYSGDGTAAIYEDYSGGAEGYGQGDLIADESEAFTLTLYADLSGGSEVEGMVTTKEISLPLEEMPGSPSIIAFVLADELSEWIGLDFKLNDVTFGEDSVTVDWAAESTLIAGLGEREQNPEFQVFDAISLNWLMMDSLAQTLKNNLDVETVYYCSDGGPVTFTNPEDMAAQGLPELPVDQPYEGSAFFVGHAGAQG